eukprot:scaffold883_cov110-Cylindrotheca_fusiformis.AAC.2
MASSWPDEIGQKRKNEPRHRANENVKTTKALALETQPFSSAFLENNNKDSRRRVAVRRRNNVTATPTSELSKKDASSNSLLSFVGIKVVNV